MAINALFTDLVGTIRKVVADYESMLFTRRLGDFSEFKIVIDPREPAAAEALIAERALKIYDGTNLRFFGQIWEPLELTAQAVTIIARDPFAGYQWRRVREGVTYTSTDAGAIAVARLALQNGYHETFMAPETGSISISNRAGVLTDGSAVITGLSTTADLVTGMYVTGLGFSGSVRLISIDSGSQITVDTPAELDTPARTAYCSPGSYLLTGIPDTSDLYAGMSVTRGGDIAIGATIASVDSSSQVTMSLAAIGTGSPDQVTFHHTPAQDLDFAFTSSASTSRTITYDAGKREDEIVKELSAMAGGFFFRVDPLDGTYGKMGTLRILYPDAGVTRSEVRFGYGHNSVDNMLDFRVIYALPINRMTAASMASTGGRLAKSAEDTTGISQYGLFEDEVAYTDVDSTTLLQAAADAGIRQNPPLTIALMPGLNSPLLFDDFDVGDFVKLDIQWGEIAFEEWVRILEAQMSVNKDGNKTMESIVIETLTGSRISQDPARLFRAQLDANRARLEALERRVQEMTVTQASAPAPPTAGGGSSGSSEQPVDTPPPPPPPPPPNRVPGVAMSQAFGFYDSRGRGAHMDGVVTPFDSTTSAFFIIRSGSPTGTVVKATPARTLGASGSLQALHEDTTGLSSGTYYVAMNAANSAGQATSGYISFTVPTVRSE